MDRQKWETTTLVVEPVNDRSPPGGRGKGRKGPPLGPSWRRPISIWGVWWNPQHTATPAEKGGRCFIVGPQRPPPAWKGRVDAHTVNLNFHLDLHQWKKGRQKIKTGGISDGESKREHKGEGIRWCVFSVFDIVSKRLWKRSRGHPAQRCWFKTRAAGKLNKIS